MINNYVTIYDSWNLTIPEIPQRSYFYNLEPIGVGTPLGESLTSYIERLALNHCVTPGFLILNKIAPFVKNNYFKISKPKSLAQIYQQPQLINGTGIRAKKLIKVLERLTDRSDIRFVTMLPWAKLIYQQDLLRQYRAWCPICYEEWHNQGKTIYSPLLWSISAVNICPQHHKSLVYVCPCCQQQLPILAARSQSGYCSKCKNWLGQSSSISFTNDNDLLSLDRNWQLYTAINVGELISLNPNYSGFVPQKLSPTIINSLLSKVAKGSLFRFQKITGLPISFLSQLEFQRPNLNLITLLQICYALKISVIGFLKQLMIL